jgi:hypothetical protein
MIKFISDLRQVGGVLRFPPQLKTNRHDIAEVLLKVALNTINPLFTDNVYQFVDAIYILFLIIFTILICTFTTV